jgi:hypothetical protein
MNFASTTYLINLGLQNLPSCSYSLTDFIVPLPPGLSSVIHLSSRIIFNLIVSHCHYIPDFTFQSAVYRQFTLMFTLLLLLLLLLLLTVIPSTCFGLIGHHYMYMLYTAGECYSVVIAWGSFFNVDNMLMPPTCLVCLFVCLLDLLFDLVFGNLRHFCWSGSILIGGRPLRWLTVKIQR